MSDSKGRPLRKIIYRQPWPVFVNGLLVWYMHELLECGHVQPKRIGLLGAYKSLECRRCDACGKVKERGKH